LRRLFSKFTGVLACAIGTFTLVVASLYAAPGPPEGSATATVNQLLASIGKLRTTTNKVQRDKLIASIDASLAIQKLSEQALGAQWSKLDGPQQTYFVTLVKQLLEKIAYPNAAQFFSDFTVNDVDEEVQGTRHIVRTRVNRSESGAVSIDYVLEPEGGRWIVVDVILDRQSLAASITSQFQATLKSSSYKDLLAQMQARLAQAASVSSH